MVRKEWRILDIRGTHIATHVRIEPGRNGRAKDFAWRMPDGTPGLGGLSIKQLPLYGVERLPEDLSTVVVVVEGEKAADALLARGIPAVGTVTGASSCPSVESLADLAGRHVVLWPDADDPGREHMVRVSKALSSLVASVRMVIPPADVSKGWDAADADAETVRRLVADATDAEPAPGDLEDPPLVYRPKLVRLADVEPAEVSWLWRPRIPRGRLTLIEGDPGLGKSGLTLAIAAAVTRGELLPDAHGVPAAAPRNVVLIGTEDGLADTVRPRLDKAGADVDRVYALQAAAMIDPEDQREREVGIDLGNLEAIREAMRSLQPAVVVVDPIQAHLGAGVDAHRANETRPILAGLARLMEEHDCAGLLVRHLAKAGAGGTMIYRGLGSIDFAGVARSMLRVARHPEDESDGNRRVLLQIKCNLALHAPALEFTIGEDGLKWVGSSEVTEGDVREAEARLGRSRGGARGPRPDKRDEAAELLRKVLPAPVQRVMAEAEDAGISEATVRRAAARLGVKPTQGGRGRPGVWRLPKDKHEGHSPSGPTDSETRQAIEANGSPSMAYQDPAPVDRDGPSIGLPRNAERPSWRESPVPCAECRRPTHALAGTCDPCADRGTPAQP